LLPNERALVLPSKQHPSKGLMAVEINQRALRLTASRLLRPE